VTKALKATVNAGIAVQRVEIDKNGKIVIVTARPEDAANEEKPRKNEWGAFSILNRSRPRPTTPSFLAA
jgi:hypothetical protein